MKYKCSFIVLFAFSFFFSSCQNHDYYNSSGNDVTILFVSFHNSYGSVSVDDKQIYSGPIDASPQLVSDDVALELHVEVKGNTKFEIDVDGVHYTEMVDIQHNVDRVLIFPGYPFDIRTLTVGESSGLD